MRKDESKFITKFFSEPGTQKKNNDYFGFLQLDNYAIWVVADGFDAEEGAEIVSKLAVESVIEYFMLHPRFNAEVIKEMIDYANLKIREKQEETERYSLMHASLLVVISNYNSFLYGNVGNTRLYHMRNGYIVSQSSDDSIAQLLVEEEALNVNDIKFHRQRNDLLQAVGDYGKIKPNLIKEPVSLEQNDVLCLTTIGFWENVEETEMEVEFSRQENLDKWLESMKNAVISTLRDDVENNTLAIVKIEEVASPEPVEKDRRKLYLKAVLIGAAILIILLFWVFFNIAKRNEILKRATIYSQQADDELMKKNFNNSIEDLKLELGEYEKLKSKRRGIIGFLSGIGQDKSKIDGLIAENKKKMEQTEKLKKAFQDVNQGNELFTSGNYDEATEEYQAAKYALEEISYKRDELNINEILETLNTRINSASKLKEAQMLEISGNQAVTAGNYNLAKENYKAASEIYLSNGKADYVANIERKISEIADKEKTEYNGAMLVENQADMLSPTDINKSREAYYKAREMYQTLGDAVKTQEIDNKIQEINSREMAKLQTANNLVKEGLSQLAANNPAEAISTLTKAKIMYEGLKDHNNVSNVEKFISQAQSFIKYESESEKKLKDLEVDYSERLKQQEIMSHQALIAKEAEIAARQNEIEQERIKREQINKRIDEATNLEMQGDQQYSLGRYSESMSKYEEAKKILEELKNSGDLEVQNSKIEYLDKKKVKSEGYLYEKEGDDEAKKKNWKEAEKKYQSSLEKMKEVSESSEIQKNIEKKLKKATKKANKKWWQFWK